MAKIEVEKVTGNDQNTPSLVDKREVMAARIRQRAFEIFQDHGSAGRELDDWLQAERELVHAPEPEITEKDGEYEIRIAAACFNPAETVVTALPDALIVCADSSWPPNTGGPGEPSCEVRKFLYGRLELPASISVDKITATLDDGILRITAQKASKAAA